jgi:hypothetical protein
MSKKIPMINGNFLILIYLPSSLVSLFSSSTKLHHFHVTQSMYSNIPILSGL